MTAPELILVVPCYNEASRLQTSALLDFVARHPSVRLLFVDDGSGDGTMAVLERLGREAPASIRAMRSSTAIVPSALPSSTKMKPTPACVLANSRNTSARSRRASL